MAASELRKSARTATATRRTATRRTATATRRTATSATPEVKVGKKKEKAKGKGKEEASSFTVEGLFDYINESAASLARVISLQRHEDHHQQEDDEDLGGWEDEDLRPRKMSMSASIKDRKSGQRVRFMTEVEVFPLPKDEGREAWLSRRGHWGAAPDEDKYWNKSTNSFKPGKDPVTHLDGESSSDEEGSGDGPTQRQVAAAMATHRDSNFSSFWEAIKPLFQRPEKSASSASSVASDDLDLEVEIELVEDGDDSGENGTPEDEDEEGDSRRRSHETAASSKRSSASRKSTERRTSKGASQPMAMSAVDHVYPPTRKKFAFKIPSEERRAKAAEDMLKTHVLGGRLSASQASAAASAGKVLVLRGADGVAFGAAVKRKVQLKTSKKARSKHSRPEAPEEFYQNHRRRRGTPSRNGKRRKLKKRPSLRSPGIGFSMRPRYIFIFFVFPLLLIGVDDMFPFFEHVWWMFTHPNQDYKLRPSQPVTIPLWLRIFYPNLRPEDQVLKNTLRFGSYVIEFGGLLVLLQMVYQLVNLFRVGQSVLEVHVSDSEGSDEESDWEDDSGDSPRDYSYLFKWQPAHV